MSDEKNDAGPIDPTHFRPVGSHNSAKFHQGVDAYLREWGVDPAKATDTYVYIERKIRVHGDALAVAKQMMRSIPDTYPYIKSPGSRCHMDINENKVVVAEGAMAANYKAWFKGVPFNDTNNVKQMENYLHTVPPGATTHTIEEIAAALNPGFVVVTETTNNNLEE
jgi:hypothetical protein